MGRTQINLQVDPDKKREWVEYVEESPETSNLSHLIRLSVTEHIQGSDGAGRSDSTGDGSIRDSEDVGEILNAINSIDNKVTDLQERVGAIERDTDAKTGYDLQRVLFELLPEARPDTATDGMGASDLARRIDAEPDEVRDALDDLDAKYTVVSSATNAPPDGSEPRTVYYRTGGSI